MICPTHTRSYFPIFYGILLITTGLVFACAVSPRTGGAKGRRLVSRLPAADTVVVVKPPRSLVVPPEYRLTFGDVVEIKIFDHPEFNETITIRPDGRIALEKVGEMIALGYTPRQFGSLLTRLYSRIIRQPDVTVFLRNFGKRNVYVLGEVNNPGGYELKDGMTVLRAVAEAGGYTQFAKLNSIIMLRNEYFRSPIAVRLDLSNFTQKPDRARDLLLVSNDIVYLPRTFIGELDGFVDRFFARLVQPPLDLYLRTVFYQRAIK